ncbi:DUF4430 domain-containing protein [Patescibacteria group bacterium]|nr:DUF4430 domain-containing protein [Patescibacteria group bacterium]
MSYIRRHKYHLIVFLVLILVAGISGYQSFKIQKTHITIREQHDTLVPEHISTSTDKVNSKTQTPHQTPNSDNLTPDETIEIKNDNVVTSTLNNQKNEVTEPILDHQSPITLKIAGEEYSTEFKEGTTVFELMQTLTAMSIKPFSFSGKDYGTGMGYFVTEINGTKNDPQAGKYWIYYINGESAKVGISNYIINKGDVIEWKYENSF